LGDGTTERKKVPVQVSGLTLVSNIAAAGYHTIAISHGDGNTYSWGNNGYGQLGNGTETDSSIPVHVYGSENDNIITIGGGMSHSVALMNGGRVMAWGLNNLNQLGDALNYSFTPEEVQF
jgi:alpha-tubulin suppressor-like RCC1 family protein